MDDTSDTTATSRADDNEYSRSWPYVVLGAVIALVIGAVIWALFLRPGEPTVDAVIVVPSVTLAPSVTPEPTATPTSTPTRTATAKPSPTATSTDPSDVVDNPIDDAIVGYPGQPVGPSSSTKPRDIVRVVQQRLIDLQYRDIVNGLYGTRTVAAVKKFQKDNDLFVDGVVGRETWAALFTSDGG